MIDQIGATVLSITAAYLSQDARESRRRWACIVGLSAQPFWFVVTWSAEQYAVMLLTVFYTYSWWRGVRTYWWHRWT